MKKQLPVIHFLLFAAVIGLILLAVSSTSAGTSEQAISAQIIAREKASVEAWQKKDKNFYTDFLADDATFFSSESPYLETDPKENFFPKFEQYADLFKMNDFQMYN